MTIEWPTNLIEEIAFRRCVIFIGAGISATAKNLQGQSPTTWKSFIEGAKNLIPPTNTESRDFVDKMLQQGNYLLALQAVSNSVEPGSYSRYLQQIYRDPNYKASLVHELIKEIDSKIVISTNFDKIYENLCNDHGYTVANYIDIDTIAATIKSTNNLIIKAHGTIDNTRSMVFTQEQFYEARKNHPGFYEILNALFQTHTVLFLGYSLNDPDINLVLESVSKTSFSGSPHYVVVKEGVETEIKKYWYKCYNVSTLEYGPEYENLKDEIMNLNESVLTYRTMKQIP